MSNLLAAVALVGQLAEAGAVIAKALGEGHELIARAQKEGREITDAELDRLVQRRREAEDRWRAHS